jgi:hypothetical protein
MVCAVLGLYTLYGVGTNVWREGLALLIGPNGVGFYLKMEIESSLQNLFLNKNMMMDNVHKHNICIDVPQSHTFRSQ